MRHAVSVLFACLLVASPAAAQSSGGSFGSSDFGGGSSGGYSGGSSGGGYSGGSSGGGSSGGGSSTPYSAATDDTEYSLTEAGYLERGEVDPSRTEVAATDHVPALVGMGTGACVFVGLLPMFAWSLFFFGRDKHAAPTGPIEVRQVTVAFDWTQRATIQASLKAMADAFAEAQGEQARRIASQRAAAALASFTGSARYAAFQSYHLRVRDAESRFHLMAGDLRSRFRHERAGARAEGGPLAMRARAEEGEGMVVVSMVVSWRGHMRPLPTKMDAAAAADAFGTLEPTGPPVLALEVIWSPAEENDRMSSAELEALYPELIRLDGEPSVGRIACSYCHAVLPAELGECIACGAPVST